MQNNLVCFNPSASKLHAKQLSEKKQSVIVQNSIKLYLEEDVQLERRLCEGEKVVSPAHLHISEQVSGQAGQQALQVLFDHLCRDFHYKLALRVNWAPELSLF